MLFDDSKDGRALLLADPNDGWGRGRSTQDTSEVVVDHGRVPSPSDANFAGASSDEDGGERGTKRKKKNSFKFDADERFRKWHFRSERRARQRLVVGVA